MLRWFFVLLLVALPLSFQSGFPQNSLASLAYDVQIGETFPCNSTSLSVTVIAVAQTDASGNGPAYLLNGLTNSGWWYQVGISYNWPSTGGHANGFMMNYEVFNPFKASVYPLYGGGVQGFKGQVRPGDNISLSLFMTKGLVVMKAVDEETGASAVQTYPAKGSEFVGMSNSTSNTNGFFTGIMTEWYRATLNLSEAPVRYEFSPMPSAILWISVQGAGSLPVELTRCEFFSSTPMLYSEVRLGKAQERALPWVDVTGSGLNVSLSFHPSVVDEGVRTLSVELEAVGEPAGTPIVYRLYGNSTELASVESVSGASVVIKLNATKRLILYADASSGDAVGGSSPHILFVNPDPSVSVDGAMLYDAGEVPRINVTVSGGTPPYALSFSLDGRALKNLTVPLDTLGANILNVSVTDSTGATASSFMKLYVSPDPSVLLSSDENVSEVGYPIALVATVRNGTAPYRVWILMNGSYVSDSGEFSFVPPGPGTYEFTAKVVDSTGYGALSYPVDVIVEPRLHVAVGVNLSSSLLALNSSFSASLKEEGGIPPFVVTWYVNGRPVKSDNSELYRGALRMGVNNITVVVTDSLGVNSTASLEVRSSYNPVGITLIAILAIGVVLVAYALARRRYDRLP